MGTLNLSEAVKNAYEIGEISLPLQNDLPNSYRNNPLRRSHRVNIRLREDEITTLEAMALAAGMPFQSFLSALIHKYAKGILIEK